MALGKSSAIISFLLLAISSVAQVPTPIRSVSSLPATCKGGSSIQSSDMVILVTAGVGVQYLCTAPNVWSPVVGGGGSISGSPSVSTQVSGNGSAFFAQPKAIYDVRDWATCDTARGTTTGTNATGGISTMLSTIGTSQKATVRLIGSTNPSDTCLVANLYWGPNITVDTSGGGALTLITDATAPGGGAVDVAGSTAAFNNSSSSCAVTVTPTGAGETYYLFTGFGFGSGALINAPTSTVPTDVILLTPSYQSNNNVSYLTDGWIVANVAAGSHTFTFTYRNAAGSPISTWNACRATAITGIGVTPGLDGGTGASTQNNTNPMSAGAYTFQSGSVILAQGGQHNNTETCTVGGAFTQPSAPLGQVGTSGTDCFQYINVSGAGALTATQSISSAPTGLAWTYTAVGLRPASAVNAILGGIINPDMHQIFYNSNGGQGTVDFTGNLTIKTVYPEWWGAAPGNAASANTAPMQAAEHGAFGVNRTNASGLSLYNKQLYLSGMYSINDEIQFYNVIGNSTSRWDISCAAGGGLKQTVVNKRIWDGQSNAYGTIHSCSFQGGASSTKPLVDWDYDGITTSSLATQFLTCYDCSFVGNGLVDVGLLIAKNGGGAQGSNIYCINCAGQGFTGAVMQIGGNNTGRNVGRFYALNALNIGWIGDMQACPLFGFASYGGGYVVIDNSSFECVSPLASYLTQAATAVDVYGEGTQGPITVSNSRSEDLQLIHASNPKVLNSAQIDQSTAFYSPVNCIAGGSEPLNWFIHGSDLGSDGALYQVTVHGTAFGGICLTNASSGTATTIVDTNQRIAGSNTVKTFVVGETATQATTGSTGTVLNVPVSVGTITGSVTSGTIGAAHTMTQATTGVTCTSTNAPVTTQSLLCNNFSGTADNSHIWTDGTTSGTYTPTTAPVFAPASPVMLITAATGSPDNSHNWIGGTSAAVLVPTAAPANDVNWTVNGFAGGAGAQSQVTIWGGAGVGTICSPITSNTATSITFTGCTSNFYGVHSATFGTNSQFIVEPCWGCGVTQSGDFTFAKVNPVVIGGDNVNTASSSCTIQDVLTSGGLIQCSNSSGKFTKIHNLAVSRTDWYGASGGFKLADAVIPQIMDQVQIIRPYSTSAGSGTGLKWSIGNRNGGASVVNAPLQSQMGTAPMVWSCGGPGGGTSCNDVSIGGRSDAAAAVDVFRNRVELTGMLGAPAPSGFNMTDQDGLATTIGGGPSSGAGNPGTIDFYIGASAVSGATVNTGSKVWSIDSSGNLTATGNRNISTGGTLSASTGTFTGPPGIATVTASNTDLAGQLTLSAGTKTYTFAGSYVSAPICVASDTTATNVVRVSVTNTVLTVTGTGSDVIDYICVGRD